MAKHPLAAQARKRAPLAGHFIGPERDKLQQPGARAWLYVVTHCKGGRSRLRTVQYPLSRLAPEMRRRQAQRCIEEDDRARQGREENDRARQGREAEAIKEAGERRT